MQGDIKDFADIRGHAIAVDATNTAYALQAKKILLEHGLKAGTDYTLNPVGNGTHRLRRCLTDKHNAGAILNLPFSLQAAAQGMHSLGRTTDLLGPYQADGAFVRRDWARDHAETLVNISPLTSKRCAGRSIRRTMPKPSPCWSTSSNCRKTWRRKA